MPLKSVVIKRSEKGFALGQIRASAKRAKKKQAETRRAKSLTGLKPNKRYKEIDEAKAAKIDGMRLVPGQKAVAKALLNRLRKAPEIFYADLFAGVASEFRNKEIVLPTFNPRPTPHPESIGHLTSNHVQSVYEILVFRRIVKDPKFLTRIMKARAKKKK
jgi:hypothetical protein